jgi:cobalt-zinc-cadmium efflux system outer membrane protein
LRTTTGLIEALGRLETAQAGAIAIKAEVLPVAQQSFESAQTGYREGKFGYLDVIDAQRTLGEAKTRYLEVITAYHKAAADVERLTGLSLDTIQ